VLLLEELNRAEIPVMQPALQLLSARRLHGYELPPGWMCIAAVNPEDGDYQVHHLDAALRSRFLQLAVCAERSTWLPWAERANLHPEILHVVREHLDAFDHASPRSWAYASDLLHALRPDEIADAALVRLVLRGYLPTAWSLRVADAFAQQPALPVLDASVLLGAGGAAALARAVRELEANKRVDGIAALTSRIKRVIAGPDLCARAESGAVTLEALERLVAPLPGDLREQCLDAAVESPAATALLRSAGYQPQQLVAAYAKSRLRGELQSWRREMKLHRVRLVVVAVRDWLEREIADGASAHATQLGLLAADAGPMAVDLVRWLAARDIVPDAQGRT
jgi:hypothetical protein